MSFRVATGKGRVARVVPVLALTLIGVSVPAAASALPHKPSAAAEPGYTTSEYLPGVEADLFLPSRPRPHAHGPAKPVPLIVMVPGGGWETADRSGMRQLASALAADGVAVSLATYRIGDVSSRFPVPAQDISCAVDAAAATVRQAVFRPKEVVLAGHSAGAHLSSLAAFGADAFHSDTCPYPRTRLDGWVGLSGIYDLTLVGPFAWTMMGATQEEDPEAYARAGTATYLGDRRHQRLETLVIHGDADELGIPAWYATGFADLLRERGYRTELIIVPGGGHHSTY